MHKNTLWLVLALLCIYLTLVFCEEQQQQQHQETGNDLEDLTKDLLKSDSTDLQEEARTRRRHRHHLYQAWPYALAIAYIVKIKFVIVAFFIGSAIYLGFRYMWPQKCHQEIILDHPPPSFAHHDHIPYSSDHSEHYAEHPHFDSSSSWGSSSPGASFDPYSAYSGSFVGPEGIPDTTSPETHTFRRKREVKVEEKQGEDEEKQHEVEEKQDELEEKQDKVEARQMPMASEEQIGNFMFMFLGLDSKACRRRFICEMEFRSKANPLTAMAFRIVGRSFFQKYTNDHNELGKAHSFEECAAVNAECVFIENENQAEEQQETTEEAEETANNEGEEAAAAADDDLKVELPADVDDNSLENNNIMERANYENLQAERRNSYRRRVRGDRHLLLQ